MSRRKEPPRVLGPTQERGGSSWRVVIVVGGKRTSHFAPTEAEARRLVRKLERELPLTQTQTVREVMELYLADRIATGHTLPMTASNYRVRIMLFFGTDLDRGIAEITAARSEVLYQRAMERELPKSKGKVSAATQRNELTIVKMLFNWASRRALIRQSPLGQVRPMGRPRRGKVQLRIDEARAFEAAALRRFTEKGDAVSLAALAALHLGLRASETLNLRVRDLDNDGQMLWVEGTKNERARRHLEVPDCLQVHLRKAAAGRRADGFLFGESRNGGPRDRRVLHDRVVALCKAAGVMRVCPHSLRGLWATLQARSGADPNAIARSLGHGSFEITRRHYAQASAVHGAQSERVAAILKPSAISQPNTSQTLAMLVAGLPAEARQELITLLQKPADQSIRNPPATPNSGSSSTEN